MVIYKDSHKHGYFEHKLEHPKLGKKSWTNEYTHVDPKIVKRFKKIKLKVKAGSAVLMHSAVLHTGYPTKKKGFVRIVITERYNPLKNIQFLKNPQIKKYENCLTRLETDGTRPSSGEKTIPHEILIRIHPARPPEDDGVGALSADLQREGVPTPFAYPPHPVFRPGYQAYEVTCLI